MFSFSFFFGFLLPVLLFLTTATTTTLAERRNQSHEHTGKLTSYKPGPVVGIKLSKQDEAKLASGHSVMKQTMVDPKNPAAGGGAICIQDIDAPKAAVWNQILDFDSYTKKVSKVVQSKNYHVSAKKQHQHSIKTKMVLGVLPGYSYESYYDHTFHPNQDSLTWRLDYDKKSDFDDVSGHWHLEQAPSGKTRVYYACDIALKGHVPTPILNYISKAALKQATSWVKKQSEANPANYKMAQKYKYPVSTPRSKPVLSGSTNRARDGLVAIRRPTFFRRATALLSHSN